MIRKKVVNQLSQLSSLLSRCLPAFGLLLTGALGPLLAEDTRDPKAVEIAHSVREAMGGSGAWDAVQFLRFDFKVNVGGEMRVDRSHLWDKWSGRYRYENKTKEGKQQVALFNVNDRQGAVYEDGEKLADEAAAEPLKNAYAAFINDMYWLAMPWKWLNEGVNLEYLGPKELEGKAYEVVKLSFNNVGLTPGDQYRAFVSQESNLMTYWEYTLQSGNEGAWNWEYGDYSGVKLASNHTNAEGVSINMGNVAVLEAVDDAFFTDAARMMAELP